MARKKKKTFNKMDFFLLVDLVLMTVFTITMIVVYTKTYAIPDTLCTCVFGVLGGELGIMGWIKSNKEKAEVRKQELADRKYFEKLQTDKFVSNKKEEKENEIN